MFINYYILFTVIFLPMFYCKVYPTPKNNEDATFWHGMAEKYLKRSLRWQHEKSSKTSINTAKNIIIFVGDGMGMPSITAGRIYKGQQLNGVSGEESNLSFDLFPNIGLAKTYNVDKQTPDSAGTATALFTGVKTKYGSIGVDCTASEENPTGGKLTSIMDWAMEAGKRTGFVTTTRVTHATPACLYAHSFQRDLECDSILPEQVKIKSFKDIARQLIEDMPGRGFNVIMGGGRNTMGVPEKYNETIKLTGKFERLCSRTDGQNLAESWIKSKMNEKSNYVENADELLDLDVDEIDYLLGLFAKNHIPYKAMQNQFQHRPPSLAEMTTQAIKVLDRGEYSPGYVLMVEGGRIDQAHHQNYAYMALEELLELDKAIESVLKLINIEETLVIVTADHSHALILNGYGSRGNDILEYGNKKNVEPYETLSYANGPGFWDHRLNKSESNSSDQAGKLLTWIPLESISEKERHEPLYRHRAGFPLNDSTHGGEDVPVYAYGPGSNLIRGVFEQNYVAYVMSYVGCMGPARKFNPDCGDIYHHHDRNGGNKNVFNFYIIFGIIMGEIIVNIII